MRWAVGIAAVRKPKPDTTAFHHAVCIVDAASRDEAVGKGLRVARKIYPLSNEWMSHDAVACLANQVTADPDQECRIVP